MTAAREIIDCHICGTVHLEPWLNRVEDANWGDCACSDRVTCVAHQLSPHLQPARPSDEVLAQRALEMDVRELKRWQEKRQRLLAVPALEAENLRLLQRLSDIMAVVDAQAEDDGLWFYAETAPEAYLQQQLRRLHAAVEAK